jgi:hypothetical protein
VKHNGPNGKHVTGLEIAGNEDVIAVLRCSLVNGNVSKRCGLGGELNLLARELSSAERRASRIAYRIGSSHRCRRAACVKLRRRAGMGSCLVLSGAGTVSMQQDVHKHSTAELSSLRGSRIRRRKCLEYNVNKGFTFPLILTVRCLPGCRHRQRHQQTSFGYELHYRLYHNYHTVL